MSDQLKQCEYVTGYGAHGAPPEQCDEDALPGDDYCLEHIETPLDYWVDSEWDEEETSLV